MPIGKEAEVVNRKRSYGVSLEGQGLFSAEAARLTSKRTAWPCPSKIQVDYSIKAKPLVKTSITGSIKTTKHVLVHYYYYYYIFLLKLVGW